ncbi:DUF4185 domain-containing protein [Pseudonocardia sp. GCM10023141]|uniref:DUF4185 domain-containing protein n=1 Tax=Pseudonocardia sp. GCM10023141 TaxID=3252653 RepID=UPI003615A0A8
MKPGFKVKDLTGPGHTDRFGIGGTDLGATTTAPDGRLVSVFGDTFRRPTVGGPGWRSPVALFGDPDTVHTGLEWTGSAGPGDYAAQLLRYRHNLRYEGRRVTTKLPTDVLRVGEALYLHAMVCRELGTVHWTELHCSTDNGVTWEPTGTRWPGDHHDGLFQMLTWERGGDGYVYAFTTGFQRAHGLILHRVPEGEVTDTGAWESWGLSDGRWSWGVPPTLVLPGRFGELSLRHVEGRLLLCAFDDGNYRMDVVALDSPTADLHVAPRATVLHGCNWPDEDHARGRVAQLYGGYILPGSTLTELNLVVSQWNTATNWPYRSMQFRADVSALVT